MFNMIRTKKPSLSKFIWCPMKQHYSHIDVCLKKCEESEGCGALLRYMEKINGTTKGEDTNE